MQERPIHILYVEDDINLSFVTRDNLEKEGYTITCANNGKNAWDIFRQASFDLCLLDVMLPGNDGFSLAEQIRTINPQIPILFLTAKSLKEDRIEGFRKGGDDYITKPFSIEELVLRIEIFLKRRFILDPAPIKNQTYELGKYRFEYDNLLLKNASLEYTLTQKEADVLKFLCTHPNQLIKREDILKSLWGEDDYFMGRSLDVFLSRLRKYLKDEPSIVIKNVHGIGFKMEIKTSKKP
jgi:two-component system, OmpR family, response regulator VicR